MCFFNGKNFPDAQKLSGEQCLRALGVFGPLLKWSSIDNNYDQYQLKWSSVDQLFYQVCIGRPQEHIPHNNDDDDQYLLTIISWPAPLLTFTLSGVHWKTPGTPAWGFDWLCCYRVGKEIWKWVLIIIFMISVFYCYDQCLIRIIILLSSNIFKTTLLGWAGDRKVSSDHKF